MNIISRLPLVLLARFWTVSVLYKRNELVQSQVVGGIFLLTRNGYELPRSITSFPGTQTVQEVNEAEIYTLVLEFFKIDSSMFPRSGLYFTL